MEQHPGLSVLEQVQGGLKAILSKRIGVNIALCGEAGIGKTHTAQALLHGLPCESLSVNAKVPIAHIPQLPRPRQLPRWAVEQLDRLRSGQELSEQAVVQTLITSLSVLTPFVLHIEDWHDAEPSRRQLITSLAKAVKRTPGLGLLVTSRLSLPPPFVNHTLSRLSPAETAVLLEGQLGQHLPPDCLSWVQGRTAGNPLFTLEFLRYLTQQGFLWSDGRVWHWRSPPNDFVPASVEGLIEGLIVTVEPTAKAVLEARALLPPLDESALEQVWSQIAGCGPEDFQRGCSRLMHLGLLKGVDFAHPLFGEVVGGQLAGRQAMYAQRAVAALERHWPEAAAAVLPQAGLEAHRALALLERAAAAAERRGAQGAQVQWLAQQVPYTPAEQRPQRALQAARALARAGQLNQALDCAEIAAATLPEAAVLCADLLLMQGQATAAEARLKALPQTLSAETWWQLSIRNLFSRGKFVEVLELWGAQVPWQPGAPVLVRQAVGSAYAFNWQLEPAEAMARELIALEGLTPEEQLEARSLLGQVLNLRQAPEVRSVEQETIRLAREYELPMQLGRALLNHAMGLTAASERASVREMLNEAAEIYGRLGQPLHHARCLLRLADQAMQDAEFEQAEALLADGQSMIRRTDHSHLRTESHLKHNRLYLLWRPPHGAPLALHHARQALELARQSQDQKFLQIALRRVAQAEALSGHPEPALEAVQEALGYAQAHQSQRDFAFCYQAQGLALAAAGKRNEGTALLEQAQALFQELNMPLEAQHAGLEADRLGRNKAGAQARHRWLTEQGYLGEASLALKFFPDLAEEVQPGAVQEMVPPVYLKVLGPPGLEQDGQARAYRARRRLELLAYLLEVRLAGRSEARMLELIDIFYPDEPEVRARRTLKQQIFLIRQDLGAGSILSTPGGYALGEVASDAEAFLKQGSYSLWRGPYLEGLGDGWSSGVREALTVALHSRVEALLPQHTPEAARLAGILGCMEPYDTAVLHLELRALRADGQKRTLQALYQTRRLMLLEVGEVLPEQPEAFLAGQVGLSSAL